MPFQPGNKAGLATRFSPGNRANPGGMRGTGGVQARRQALENVLAVVEDVLCEPAALERWREFLVERWQEDPFAVLRNLLPFLPRESLTASRVVGGTLQTLSVSQLRRIAATLPEQDEGPEEGEALDVESSDETDESEPATDSPQGRQLCNTARETVTETVTSKAAKTPQDAQHIANQSNEARIASDYISEGGFFL